MEVRVNFAGNTEYVVKDEAGQVLAVFKSQEAANHWQLTGENIEHANYEEVWADELALQIPVEVL